MKNMNMLNKINFSKANDEVIGTGHARLPHFRGLRNMGCVTNLLYVVDMRVFGSKVRGEDTPESDTDVKMLPTILILML